MPNTAIQFLPRGKVAALRLAAFASLTAAAMTTASHAADDEEEIPFKEAVLFINLNDTDGDLGLAAKIDADGWRRLQIEGPKDRRLLQLRLRRGLARQGLTELQIESTEPEFDDLAPDAFFRRFPEGLYEIEARGARGLEFESETELSHVLPAPPGNVRVSGTPTTADCEAGPSTDTAAPIVISWDPVTAAHPEVGEDGPVDVLGYQVVVEREEPSLLVFSTDLPPSATEISVPPEFLALGPDFKFEILVTEASGNRTAIESCFRLAS